MRSLLIEAIDADEAARSAAETFASALLSARAGLVTAIMWPPPEAEMT